MKKLLFFVPWVLWVPYVPQAHAAPSLADRVKTALSSESQDFSTWQQLESELDRAPKTPRHELQRFQVLMRAAESLPYDPAERNAAMKAWLKRHELLIHYDEISGRHLVDVQALWALFERARTAPEAEDIAFVAAMAPRGGECEGYLPCIVSAALSSAGRYFEEFPQGAHAAEVAEQHLSWLVPETDFVAEELLPEERGSLLADLEPWRAILAPTAFPDRAEKLRQLNRLLAKLGSEP